MSVNDKLEKSWDNIEGLQNNIGYKFKDIQLLKTAMTHASAMLNSARNNKHSNEHYYYYEQLEFLGDRVLGLVVAHMIYDLFPSEAEGDWAKRHTGAVREETLAKVAEKFSLGEYLKLSSGEQRSGGRKKKALLADAMEALIAAIYLDAGFDTVKKFIEENWLDILQSEKLPPEDPKTRLQEWLQAKGISLPKYEVISRTGPDHAPIFEVSLSVEGIGRVSVKGSSKRQAEKEAAKLLLTKIKE